VRGADKILMLVQYVAKLLVHFTNSTEHRKYLENLARPVGDSRMLFRYYGLIPLINGFLQLEKGGAKTIFLLWLQRLENIFNLIYFPLEHSFWLGSHEVVPMSKEKIKLLGLWSCRCWVATVILSFLHLWEDFKLISQRESKLKSKSQENEQHNIAKEKHRILLDAFISLCYLPMSIHYSSENSPFTDNLINLFGVLASFGEIAKSWKLTAK